MKLSAMRYLCTQKIHNLVVFIILPYLCLVLICFYADWLSKKLGQFFSLKIAYELATLIH
jgi:hypothetical protein